MAHQYDHRGERDVPAHNHDCGGFFGCGDEKGTGVLREDIKAGAFDAMAHKRRPLHVVHETAIDQYVDIKKNEAIGQDSLFAGLGDDDDGGGFGVNVAIPEIDEWDKMTLLGHEREMLGLYVSDHPLNGLEHVLSQGTDCSIGQLIVDEERADGSSQSVQARTTYISSIQYSDVTVKFDHEARPDPRR